jgi:hypothetical protein
MLKRRRERRFAFRERVAAAFAAIGAAIAIRL